VIDVGQFTNISAIAVLVMIAIQALKRVHPLSDGQKDWVPLLALALGMMLGPVLGYAARHPMNGPDIVAHMLGGFLAGAESVGLYEVVWDKVKRLSIFRAESVLGK